LSFASSESKISKSSEKNTIADDTGNRREQTHLHGTKKYVQLTTSENAEINIVQRPFESSKASEINS